MDFCYAIGNNIPLRLNFTLGFVCNAVFVICVWRYRAFHENLRFLLINTDCNLDCNREHFLFQLVVVGILAMSLAHIVLGLERAYATLRVTTYESRHSRWIPAMLISFQWGIPLLYVFTQLRSIPSTVFCIPNAAELMPAIFPGVALELLAATLFTIVRLVNQRKQSTSLINHAIYTLPVRYQIEENMRATRMLFRCTLFHAAMYGWGYASMILVYFANDRFTNIQDPIFPNAMLFFEVAQSMPCLYATLFPVIALRGDVGLRHSAATFIRFRSWFNRVEIISEDTRTRPTGTEMQATDAHFEMLTSTWNHQHRGSLPAGTRTV